MMHNAFDTAAYPHLTEGNWVNALTIDGHNVVGFITKLENIDKTAQIHVTHACCNRVAALEWAPMKHVVHLDDTKYSEVEGYILNAIDWALVAGDKAYFMQMTDELRKITEGRKYPKPSIMHARLF